MNEDDLCVFVFNLGVNFDDFVCVINEVGVVLGDLMVIFEVLKEVGVING